jgi:hypothetical protein
VGEETPWPAAPAASEDEDEDDEEKEEEKEEDDDTFPIVSPVSPMSMQRVLVILSFTVWSFLPYLLGLSYGVSH